MITITSSVSVIMWQVTVTELNNFMGETIHDCMSCVAFYTTSQVIEQALQALQSADVDLAGVSVIGRGYQHESQAAGFYLCAGEQHYLGEQAAFWKHVWLVLPDTAFFYLPGGGSLVVGGKMVGMIARGMAGTDIAEGFSIAGAAFYMAGIPRRYINEYEQMIAAGQLMLLVQGSRQEIEYACTILHSEKQQITVHRA